MQAKKDLAARIVKDFHSEEAAVKAAEDWAKQFQKSGVPESVEEVEVSVARIGVVDVTPDSAAGGAVQSIDRDPSEADPVIIRADKLLREAGLAVSVTEAGRKIKERAVEINGKSVNAAVIMFSARQPLTVRVGKRVKRVRFVP